MRALIRIEYPIEIGRVSIDKERRLATRTLAKASGTLDHRSGAVHRFGEGARKHQTDRFLAGLAYPDKNRKEPFPNFGTEWAEAVNQQRHVRRQIDRSGVRVQD